MVELQGLIVRFVIYITCHGNVRLDVAEDNVWPRAWPSILGAGYEIPWCYGFISNDCFQSLLFLLISRYQRLICQLIYHQHIPSNWNSFVFALSIKIYAYMNFWYYDLEDYSMFQHHFALYTYIYIHIYTTDLFTTIGIIYNVRISKQMKGEPDNKYTNHMVTYKSKWKSGGYFVQFYTTRWRWL